MSGLHRSAAWQAFTKVWRPIIQRRLPLPCLNSRPDKGCTGIVLPGEAFDVAHVPGFDYMITGRMPTPSEVGAAHSTCNRSEGAKLAAARRKAQRARDDRMPNW